MIGKYVLGGAGILVAVMAVVIWLMIQERDALNEQMGELSQANSQLEQTLEQQEGENTGLRTEIDRRDAAVLSAERARREARERLTTTLQQLDEALADDPCAYKPVPAAAIERLQTGTRRDQD